MNVVLPRVRLLLPEALTEAYEPTYDVLVVCEQDIAFWHVRISGSPRAAHKKCDEPRRGQVTSHWLRSPC